MAEVQLDENLHPINGGAVGPSNNYYQEMLKRKELEDAQLQERNKAILSGQPGQLPQETLDVLGAINAGQQIGQREFYDDPEMIAAKKRREDLAQGYSGQEIGALKGQAMSDIAGQRSSYLQQLKSNLAKRGVGGARAAACSR